MAAELLVIGALGNVGSEVLKNLLAAGREVRAADIAPEKIAARFGSAVEPVFFDFGKPETFSRAFTGIKAMFLMRPPQIADVKKYMLPALEAAQTAGVKQVVFLSLIGIEQNQIAPHYKVEQWLKQSGMDYTFLRCSFFMQNLNTTHRSEIRENNEIFVPVGSARTSFIDVRDIGAVAALTMLQPGHARKAYDLTGGEALDYYQVAEIFSSELRRRITYKNPSAVQFFFRQVNKKQSLAYALVTTWLYNNTRRGMADQITGEVQRLLARPPISMRQYVQDYREQWE